MSRSFGFVKKERNPTPAADEPTEERGRARSFRTKPKQGVKRKAVAEKPLEVETSKKPVARSVFKRRKKNKQGPEPTVMCGSGMGTTKSVRAPLALPPKIRGAKQMRIKRFAEGKRLRRNMVPY